MDSKTLLVHVPSPFVVKNFITTDAFSLLLERKDTRIVLLVPYFKENHYREFCARWKNVSIRTIPEDILLNKLDLVYQFVIQNSLPTSTVRIKQYKFLYSSKSPFPVRVVLFTIMRIFWNFGKFRIWKYFVGGCYKLISPRSFEALFKEEGISLLYVPTMLHSTDLRLILEARRKRVPIVGTVASWDNLTAKLLLPYPPNVITVGNATVRSELIRYDGIPDSRIRVTGYPQYDRYLRKEDLIDRSSFCCSIGLNPEKPYILYAMAGPKNMRTDMSVLTGIKHALDSGALGDLQVLIRPYPKYLTLDYEERNLAQDSRFVFDENVASLLRDIDHWEFSKRDIAHLTNSVHHAAITVSVASTILIDAAVLDRPFVNIAFSGTERIANARSYYTSPERYLAYEHMRKLIESKALVSAKNSKDLKDILQEYLDNANAYAHERQNLKMLQCGYVDGLSGKRLGNVLEGELNHLSSHS